MTKQKAIKELVKLGWTDIVPDGRFCVYATSPSGSRGLFDPKDLLTEILSKSTISTELE